MTGINTIEEALEELKSGKIILVTDDLDRENEGDFICAAQFATTANINFMATNGKGLICMPMSEKQPPQGFPLPNDPLRHFTVWPMTRSPKIFAGQDICFLCWQKNGI